MHLIKNFSDLTGVLKFLKISLIFESDFKYSGYFRYKRIKGSPYFSINSIKEISYLRTFYFLQNNLYN